MFSVHRTNNKVLSLFGYIHVKDVKVLEKRCEDYIQDHLQDENLKKADTGKADGVHHSHSLKEEDVIQLKKTPDDAVAIEQPKQQEKEVTLMTPAEKPDGG